MKRIDCILSDKEFITRLKRIGELEETRIFCCHGMDHLLDVARIAYIIDLEEGLSIPKDVIYGMSLLHDLGRSVVSGKSHREALRQETDEILERAGFTEEERADILLAIRNHGNEANEKGTLSDVLYRADKLSRDCHNCKAYDECYWEESKKSRPLEY